mmetsp:Transcript_50460/g.134156  ORF Transcript_50460/g.134156 Transcript_50460/m.134156 type:complete len:82 (+) Transcript_50460:198-443(+)
MYLSRPGQKESHSLIRNLYKNNARYFYSYQRSRAQQHTASHHADKNCRGLHCSPSTCHVVEVSTLLSPTAWILLPIVVTTS